MKIDSKKIVVLCIIAAVFLFVAVSGISGHLTFENLLKNKEQLHDYVREHYTFSVVAYILIYVLTTAFSVPGAAVLTLAGGFLFGTVPGAVYVNAGATTGAVLAFLSSRYLIGDSIQKKYHDRLEQFNEETARNGHFYLLTLRFVPVFPFFLINVLAGLTSVPLRTFLWTTSVGIVPGSLVYAFAGSQISTISSVKEIMSVRVLSAFMFLALLSLLPAVLNRIKSRAGKSGHAE